MSSNNIRVRNYGQSYPIYKSFAFFSSKDNVENNNDHDFVASLTVKLPSLYIDATSQNQSNANNKSETHERIKYSCERLSTYLFSTSASNVNKNENFASPNNTVKNVNMKIVQCGNAYLTSYAPPNKLDVKDDSNNSKKVELHSAMTRVPGCVATVHVKTVLVPIPSLNQLNLQSPQH